jgi:hypothetical protein
MREEFKKAPFINQGEYWVKILRRNDEIIEFSFYEIIEVKKYVCTMAVYTDQGLSIYNEYYRISEMIESGRFVNSIEFGLVHVQFMPVYFCDAVIQKKFASSILTLKRPIGRDSEGISEQRPAGYRGWLNYWFPKDTVIILCFGIAFIIIIYSLFLTL